MRGTTTATAAAEPAREQQSFLLQRVQAAMTGLIDGSLSTLAPTLRSRSPRIARHRVLCRPCDRDRRGSGMAFSEGLSDTGDLTGRSNPYLRGSITGVGTFLGGILHTLPFLITDYYRAAVALAVVTVAFELVALACIRWRFFETGFLRSFASIALGGAIIAGLSAALGTAAG